MAKKNTRLVYVDEQNLMAYNNLPPEDFKEFMMAYLTYQPGDDMSNYFSNPVLYSMFISYQSKIDFNEAKWENRNKTNRENGKKGGRPKKNESQQIKPNLDFDNEEVANIPNVEIKPNEDFEEEISSPMPEISSTPVNEPEINDYEDVSLPDEIRQILNNNYQLIFECFDNYTATGIKGGLTYQLMKLGVPTESLDDVIKKISQIREQYRIVN